MSRNDNENPGSSASSTFKSSSRPVPPSLLLPSNSSLRATGGFLATAVEVAGIYNNTPIKTVILGQHNTGKRLPKVSQEYTIYTAQSLGELVGLLRNNYQAKRTERIASSRPEMSSEKNSEMHTIRYLLRTDDVLVFATEGIRPPHYAMSGETQKPANSAARCAGNLVFNEDFSEVKIVNNKSGDFQPEPVLMKRVFAVLMVLHDADIIVLPKTLHIEHERQRIAYTVERDVLREYIKAEFSDDNLNKFLEDNRGAEKHTVHYKSSLPLSRLSSSPWSAKMGELRRGGRLFGISGEGIGSRLASSSGAAATEPERSLFNVSDCDLLQEGGGGGSRALNESSDSGLFGLFSGLPALTDEAIQREERVDKAIAKRKLPAAKVSDKHPSSRSASLKTIEDSAVSKKSRFHLP